MPGRDIQELFNSVFDTTNNALKVSSQSGTSVGTLTSVAYNPAVQETKSTNSTAGPVDLDATNLIVTFTVPASGIVIIEMSAWVQVNSSCAAAWTLMEGASEVTGARQDVIFNMSTVQQRCTYLAKFTGLTPGASKTWKWAQLITFSTGTVSTKVGGVSGQGIIEVRAA